MYFLSVVSSTAGWGAAKFLGDQELGPLHLAAKLGDSEALRFLSFQWYDGSMG